ncbi:MAG: hypothetical protein HZB26_19745 [Candidatus Hydrogenedentes bacterium]|nr:hypothetical protein [Candidatus Hydrogenedentota bacterium]
METLRIHVERVVRPIRASVRRKNTMREELLGHLTRKAQTSLSNGATEADACAAAVEQLGDPSVLRQELQATVPRLERLMYAHMPCSAIADGWYDRQTGETAVRFALRRAAYTTLFLVIVLGAILATAAIAQSFGITLHSAHRSPASLAERALTIAALCALQAAAAFIAYLLADVSGLRGILARTNNSGAWRKAAALFLFLVGYLLLFLAPSFAALSAFKPEALAALLSEKGLRQPLLFGSLFIVGGFPLIGWAMTKEHEQYEKWGRLRLDE